MANKQKESMLILREMKKDYLHTFNSERGKRVLKSLEKMCFINQTPHSDAPGRTEYNVGLQMVVIHIKNMMNMNIDEIAQLVGKGE